MSVCLCVCQSVCLSVCLSVLTHDLSLQAFLADRGYPSWVQVSRVLDGGETALFKQYFADWVDEGDVVAPVPEGVSGDNVAGKEIIMFYQLLRVQLHSCSSTQS